MPNHTMARYYDYETVRYSQTTFLVKERICSLQARRGELESLDLAIERQKSSLRKMKETEKFLMSEREAAKKELKDLKKNRSTQSQRKYV